MGLMVVDEVFVEGDGDFFKHFSKVLTKELKWEKE